MIQIYHNNRCGKSREALKVIVQLQKPFTVIKYLENPLSSQEIEVLLKQLMYKPIDLVRQKERIWIENFKEKNLADQEIINALAENPILIERPIVTFNDKAIIARNLEILNGFL